MVKEWRRWMPVALVALALIMVAWLVSAAHQAGHRMVAADVPPAGLPPGLLEYVPDGFFDDLPDDVDFSEGDVPPEWLDRLASELSAEEIDELSNALSDDVRADLLERMTDDLDRDELNELASGLDQSVIDELEQQVEDNDPNTADDPETDADEQNEDTDTPEENNQDNQVDQDESDDESGESWWSTLLSAIGRFLLYFIPVAVLLALVGFVGYGLFRLVREAMDRRRDRSAEPEQPEPEPEPEQAAVEQVREAVRDGMSDIDSGTDPRTAVIACWQNLETAAADIGIARLAADTPTDLVRRLLQTVNVDDAVLEGLMHSYHLARYAPHDVTEELRGQAREALAAVDERLAAAAAERAEAR